MPARLPSPRLSLSAAIIQISARISAISPSATDAVISSSPVVKLAKEPRTEATASPAMRAASTKAASARRPARKGKRMKYLMVGCRLDLQPKIRELPAQLGFLDFSRRGVGNLLHHHHRVGQPPFGDLAAQMRDQGFMGGRSAFPGHT